MPRFLIVPIDVAALVVTPQPQPPGTGFAPPLIQFGKLPWGGGQCRAIPVGDCARRSVRSRASPDGSERPGALGHARRVDARDPPGGSERQGDRGLLAAIPQSARHVAGHAHRAHERSHQGRAIVGGGQPLRRHRFRVVRARPISRSAISAVQSRSIPGPTSPSPTTSTPMSSMPPASAASSSPRTIPTPSTSSG
jgi:hypothetical protein